MAIEVVPIRVRCGAGLAESRAVGREFRSRNRPQDTTRPSIRVRELRCGARGCGSQPRTRQGPRPDSVQQLVQIVERVDVFGGRSELEIDAVILALDVE